jgi:outer membrane receptor protein involved in Fe transport
MAERSNFSGFGKSRPALSTPVIRTVLLASTMMTMAPIAAAQDAEPQARSGGVDNIVVTAQKREESIQDVPLSIIALPTEQLEQLEISAFEDYVRYLPSVTFQSTGPSSTSIYMRGVVSGGDGNHSASLPSVGVYLDEQPVTTILGFLPVHIYDIQRVEALAGPQGTLFGASSQAGTLRIITNKPELGETYGRIDLEGNKVHDGEYGYQFEGMLNKPVSENAAIRLVAWYKKDAGFIDNVLDSRTFPTSGITKTNAAVVEDDFNTVETYGARIALKIDLDENWTMTPSWQGQRQDVDGIFAFDPKLGDLNVGRFEDDFSEDKWFQGALTLEGKIGDFDLVYAGAYLKRQIDSSYDYTDYAYYYDVLYGYGAYFYDDMYNLVDPTQFYQGDDSFSKYSNEIRISSPQDKRLRVVAGLFQNRQSHFIHQQYIVRDMGTLFEVTDHPDTIWLTEQHRVDRDYAIFGEVALDLSDSLTLTGGIRGYKVDNTLVGFFGYNANFSSGTGEAVCFAGPIVQGSPCTNLDKEVKETGETHKVNLTYKVDDDKMVYFTYSTGFRPGGINRRGTLPPYLSDTLVNYEVGAKTAWFDNTLIFNAALFWQQWQDFQFPILGQNGLTEIKNANQARIRGFEADATWAPTDNFTWNGAVSIINAELTANYCGFVNAEGRPETNCPSPEAPAGTGLPVVPRFKGTMTARYEFPLGAMTGHVQGSVSGQSHSRSSLLIVDQSILGNQKGYATADFNVGVKSEDWELVGYVTNAFDERADTFDFVACAIGTCGQHAFQGTNQPRTYGVRLGKEF